MADLVTCLLVLFSGIAKGVAADSVWWQLFDVYLHLGGGAISTTASIATTVMVTVERLITIRYISVTETHGLTQHSKKTHTIMRRPKHRCNFSKPIGGPSGRRVGEDGVNWPVG